jgi:uncharacterized protein YecE (DUF72 family)
VAQGQVRIGIGGWTYAPWRGSFYPDDLPQRRELEYASRQFAAIEINATFYGRQSPKSWAAWEKEAPECFQFAVKGSRYVVTRPKLADAEEGLGVYFAQGMAALRFTRNGVAAAGVDACECGVVPLWNKHRCQISAN